MKDRATESGDPLAGIVPWSLNPFVGWIDQSGLVRGRNGRVALKDAVLHEHRSFVVERATPACRIGVIDELTLIEVQDAGIR